MPASSSWVGTCLRRTAGDAEAHTVHGFRGYRRNYSDVDSTRVTCAPGDSSTKTECKPTSTLPVHARDGSRRGGMRDEDVPLTRCTDGARQDQAPRRYSDGEVQASSGLPKLNQAMALTARSNGLRAGPVPEGVARHGKLRFRGGDGMTFCAHGGPSPTLKDCIAYYGIPMPQELRVHHARGRVNLIWMRLRRRLQVWFDAIILSKFRTERRFEFQTVSTQLNVCAATHHGSVVRALYTTGAERYTYGVVKIRPHHPTVTLAAQWRVTPKCSLDFDWSVPMVRFKRKGHS
ncbi:hypothetical protein EDB84DRAFT_1440797 [Lactarius hengduanensis]|nr:hypothetical protein EDB84DRAFT_1440797 [Lactarius hengduanensis]